MPTKPTIKRKPVRSPIKPVKPMGLRPIVIVLVVILAIVAGVSAYYFFKTPPQKTEGPTSGPARPESPGTDAGQEAGPIGTAVAKAKLQLETVDGKATIRVVIARATGTDGRDVIYRFDWTVNGQPAGEGSDRLNSGFKRGDRITAKVTPVEGDKPGQARLLEFLVNNLPPEVAESKQVSFDGKTFIYQVRGSDPDGDTLSYTLEDAPEGMTINSQTGLVTWQVKEGDYGEKTFKVKIDDGKSGIAINPIKVDIQKPSQETKPPEQQK